MEYELEARHDSRKSFYKKAIVREEGGKKTLISYNFIVCFIENGKAFVKRTYSMTTSRHIKEFLKQNGFKAETTAQILKDYPFGDYKEKENKKDTILKSVGLVASLGDIFCKTQKNKNDWKLRMLKAGLEKKGLSFPEDWSELTEKEKERRLNGAIKIIN